ncbi:MAG: hypothetical protein H0U99_04845 [Chthoniobacterales bacterium]|nr:hypothetical protein [Chthoniobacterales bacterium]
MDRYSLPAGFEDWLAAELEKCIPGCLKLLNDIYYFWLGTDKHTRNERLRPREAILARAHDQYTSLPVETFINSFDPAFPYTLFHLIFTSDYRTPEDVPLNSLEDWKWIGEILLRAVDANATEMMPQVLVLVGTDDKRDQTRLSYSFDDARLEVLFGDRAADFLKRVADRFPIYPELDQQAKQLVELAITEAGRRRGVDTATRS